MSIQAIVENELVQDASSVWVLKEHGDFGYSDGAQSEEYLDSVLRRAKDLGSRSSELESYIKDWPSEYHLTTRRAQLLSGFNFDRSLKVLEVGCGCGAITRYLGESFDDVVSVEGSIARARLARLRTRDLPGVSILCAPFEKIRFARRFDIIFCVGVYEYSGSFVAGPNPYDAVLRYFSSLLMPNGIVVIAIENQFGLKYFGSSREDHLGVMFAGVEGYHSRPGIVRTFGKVELEDELRKYFTTVRFYYPYPDYKLPDCVIADEFLATPRAGELVSQIASRDYYGPTVPLLDESLVSLELARNRALPFFANSFLVLAGKGALDGVSFDQLAVTFSSQRRAQFRTRTRIVQDAYGSIIVSKRSAAGAGSVDGGVVKLVDTDSAWIDAPSLQTLVYARSKSQGSALEAIFEPCRGWVDLLDALCVTREGVKYLCGEHVDCIWPNVYPATQGYEIVDREWVWSESLRLNVVVIRAIYNFLSRFEHAPGLAAPLRVRSGKALIHGIAQAIGVQLQEQDFEQFIDLETRLQEAIFGIERERHVAFLRWYLLDRSSLNALRSAKQRSLQLSARVRRAVSRLT